MNDLKKQAVFTRLKPATKKAIEDAALDEERSVSFIISRICDQWAAKK